jgi:tetratricopeptide (TPR) repeat protein
MRRVFLISALLCAATAASAQDSAPSADGPAVLPGATSGPADPGIASAADCEAAIKSGPAQAREKAALWYRLGGGTEARLCEAAALEAMGADATAAQLLTGVAQNPNRAMDLNLRATTYEDAARLWLRLDRPDLARDALLSANRLTDPTAARFVDLARAQAGLEDWTAARDALDQALALDPDDAMAIALRAATLRHLGDTPGALAEARRALALSPDQPEALFEEAAALATTGDTGAAEAAWMRLITTHPDSDLAAPARRNLQRLSEAASEPTPRPPEQPGPRPRPAVPPRG